MALELVLRRHDPTAQDKDAPLFDTMVHLLGYADDVVVLGNLESESAAANLETRITKISEVSKDDADMFINTD